MRVSRTLLAASLVAVAADGQRPVVPYPSLGPVQQRVLEIHNLERAMVGAAPLRWNVQLERDATEHAQLLAREGRLFHAPREGRGIARENLNQAPIGWGPDQLMRNWLDEKRYFYAGVYPNVCTGGWARCAHYTQIIWPDTTDIGCGLATDRRFNWFVCRYSPGGNKDGKTVGAAQRSSNLSIFCASSSKELANMKKELEELKARKASVVTEIARVQRAMQAAVPARYDPSLLERLLGTTQAPSTEQLAALSRELAALRDELRAIDTRTKAILQKLQSLQARTGIC